MGLDSTLKPRSNTWQIPIGIEIHGSNWGRSELGAFIQIRLRKCDGNEKRFTFVTHHSMVLWRLQSGFPGRNFALTSARNRLRVHIGRTLEATRVEKSCVYSFIVALLAEFTKILLVINHWKSKDGCKMQCLLLHGPKGDYGNFSMSRSILHQSLIVQKKQACIRTLKIFSRRLCCRSQGSKVMQLIKDPSEPHIALKSQ